MRGTVVCFHRCFAAHLFQVLSLFFASMTLHSARFSVRRQFRTAVRRVRRQRRMPVDRGMPSCLSGDYILEMAVISESSCSGPVAVALGLLSRDGSVFFPEPDRKRWTFGMAAGVAVFFSGRRCVSEIDLCDGGTVCNRIVAYLKKAEREKKCTECVENLRIILV